MKIIIGDFSKSLLTRLIQPVCCRSEVTESILPVRSVAEIALLAEGSFWRDGSALLWRSKGGPDLADLLLAELSRRDENVCFQCSKRRVSCIFSVRGAFLSLEEDESVIAEIWSKQ